MEPPIILADINFVIFPFAYYFVNREQRERKKSVRRVNEIDSVSEGPSTIFATLYPSPSTSQGQEFIAVNNAKIRGTAAKNIAENRGHIAVKIAKIAVKSWY